MSRFRTTELSDPQFESNNLRFITVKTPHLKGRGDICVFVPAGERPDNLPLVTLLHGVYGSAWIWAHKAGVHLTAQRLIDEGRIPPMAIAMPSDGLWGDGSAYLPHNHLNFEKWIAEDVPAAVQENIEAVTEQSPQFIGGLSMGGFGALRIGAKYHPNYRGISGHSSITALDQMTLFVEEPLENYRQEDAMNKSVLETVLENRDHLPALRFDCGQDDLLIEQNRTLHTQLTEAGIAHSYEEFAGEHAWPYWEEHVVDSLCFFSTLLQETQRTIGLDMTPGAERP